MADRAVPVGIAVACHNRAGTGRDVGRTHPRAAALIIDHHLASTVRPVTLGAAARHEQIAATLDIRGLSAKSCRPQLAQLARVAQINLPLHPAFAQLGRDDQRAGGEGDQAAHMNRSFSRAFIALLDGQLELALSLLDALAGDVERAAYFPATQGRWCWHGWRVQPGARDSAQPNMRCWRGW